MSTATTDVTAAGGNTRTNCTGVTAAGAHGAIVWPAGAHGRWHGDWRGADGMSIPAIPGASDAEVATGP